jgi:hypothetical protein
MDLGNIFSSVVYLSTAFFLILVFSEGFLGTPRFRGGCLAS